MMTRKDFILFAQMFGLRAYLLKKDGENLYGFNMAFVGFCDICEQINPRFDREKFTLTVFEVANDWFEKEEE